jgi:hypothetical protein
MPASSGFETVEKSFTDWACNAWAVTSSKRREKALNIIF